MTIPASLRDEFGQTLGAPQTESFDVGELTPALMTFSRQLTTTDPSAKQPSVSVTSVGHQTLKVEVYAADPSRWLEYQDVLQRWYGDDQQLTSWQRLSTTTITVDGGGHDLTESSIDLSADLHGADARRPRGGRVADPPVPEEHRALLPEPADDHVGAGHVDRRRRDREQRTADRVGHRP